MTPESLRPLVRDTAALRASLEQQLEQADKLLGTLVAGRITSGPDTRADWRAACNAVETTRNHLRRSLYALRHVERRFQ